MALPLDTPPRWGPSETSGALELRGLSSHSTAAGAGGGRPRQRERCLLGLDCARGPGRPGAEGEGLQTAGQRRLPQVQTAACVLLRKRLGFLTCSRGG